MAFSSSPSCQWKYDVFLSFRGKDTRDTFTSHLYDALCRKNIKTFIDNELERGAQIGPQILRKIEESRISVIIFSKNYASSSWCVDELVKILECEKIYKQIVLPVFYHVDPSEVDELRGDFGNAFAELERNFKGKMDKVPRWRAVLTEAANISGWDSQVTKPDAKLVNEIVEYIKNKLNHASLSNSEGLVGVESHISEIKSLLNCPHLCILGLWGMAGIGKTTLSRAIFSNLSDEYEASWFLTNISEISEESRGLGRLKEELLSSLLGENLSTLNIGSTSIKNRLGCKKVLIVLDDVNAAAQVEFLISRRDSFGPGSRILVTSRDKHVLEIVVDKIYEIGGLNCYEARQLLCLHAFKGNCPTEDYIGVSNKVVNYAQGNPLALKVLGSFLYNRRKQDWESQLNKLERFPHPDIQKVLKISFDALDDDVKNIFLDIACCFIGEHVLSVKNILDGCGFYSDIGIAILVDKCLLNISENKLAMHHLLQEMAYEIVRQQSVLEVGDRSRLWNPEDVYKVLTKNLGTKRVEAIFIDSSRIGEMKLSSRAFSRMRNLRLLKIFNSGSRDNCKLLLPHGLKSLSDNLRYLHWDGYPLGSLPSSFLPVNLVELDLSFSKVKKLWQGPQDVVNLKDINLSYCQNLVQIPDLSQAKSLERLKLESCSSLVAVHSSVCFLDRLIDLDLTDCKNLQFLPSGIYLRSLKTLKFSGCSSLKRCPEISGSITYLNLNGTAIEGLAPSVCNLGRLIALNLKDCKRLENLPEKILLLRSLILLDLSGCSRISKFPNVPQSIRYLYLKETAMRELPSSICCLSSLVILDLRNCKVLKSLPCSFRMLGSLEKLIISGCSSITNLPEVPRNLKLLYLDETAIEQVPSSICHASDLVELHLCNCKKFKILPSSICKLKALQRLNLSGCSKFQSLPEILEPMKSLRYLCLDGTAIRELPTQIENLQWLSCLELGKCKNLVKLPDPAGVIYSAKLAEKEVGLKYLRKLDLNGCSVLEVPFSVGCLSSLEALDLSGNNMESLPISINKLFELQYLGLRHCEKLKSLPDLPPCLAKLDAYNCTSLTRVSCSSILACGNIFEFSFVNCFLLDDIFQNTIMEYALKKIQLYTKRLFVQVPSVPAGISSVCFPGIKIPKWFVHQAWGSSITVQLPSHSLNGKFVGFMLCAIVSFRTYAGNFRFGFRMKCRYQFKSRYGDCLSVETSYGGWHEWEYQRSVKSSHLFLGYDPCLDASAGDSFGKYSEVVIDFYPEDMDYCLSYRGVIVINCGVRPLYAQDEDCDFVMAPSHSHGLSLLHREIEGARGYKFKRLADSANTSCRNKRLRKDKGYSTEALHVETGFIGNKGVDACNEVIDPRRFIKFFVDIEPSLLRVLVQEPPMVKAFVEELTQMSKRKFQFRRSNEVAEKGWSGVNGDMEIDTDGYNNETEVMDEEISPEEDGIDAEPLELLQPLVEEQIRENMCNHWDVSHWLKRFMDALSGKEEMSQYLLDLRSSDKICNECLLDRHGRLRRRGVNRQSINFPFDLLFD